MIRTRRVKKQEIRKTVKLLKIKLKPNPSTARSIK